MPTGRDGLKSFAQEPMIVIDGAHNEEGVNALVEELNKRYPSKKKKLVFSALADKKLDKMIHKLDEVADKITFVSFDYPRATPAEELQAYSHHEQKSFNDDWKLAIGEEVRSLETDEILVVTGSLYFISVVKPYLANLI